MFMVAISIINTILMSVLERTREWGLLSALGTKGSYIISLIIWETMCLTIIGVIFGMMIATPVNYWLIHYGYPLPEPLEIGGMYFEKMTSEVTVFSMSLPLVVALIFAFLSSLLPAIKAASTRPAEALRTF